MSNSMPPVFDSETQARLRQLEAFLSTGQMTQRIKKRLLTEGERAEFDGLLENRNIVVFWTQIKLVSYQRALLDLGRRTDHITANEFDWLMKGIGEVAEQNPPATQPRWDVELCRLYWGTELIRKIRGRSVASRIVQILDAFEEEGWPDKIDDPLSGGGPQGMRETIQSLNKNLKRMRFRADGTGEAIIWEPA